MTLQKFISEVQVSNFEAIKAQICKDFDMAGIAFSASDMPPDAFFNTLNVKVKELNQTAVSELKNLLYRIDASEQYIQKMSLRYNLPLEDLMTLAIIKRTAEKIAFREKFKK